MNSDSIELLQLFAREKLKYLIVGGYAEADFEGVTMFIKGGRLYYEYNFGSYGICGVKGKVYN